MSKLSKIVKNEKRKVIVARYAARRQELKRIIAAPGTTPEQRDEAQAALQKLPRDASPVRVRSRDVVDGRPRGILSRFGVSRIRFREMAHRGELPGITKSSW